MPRKSGPIDAAVIFFGFIILVIVGIVTVISQYPSSAKVEYYLAPRIDV